MAEINKTNNFWLSIITVLLAVTLPFLIVGTIKSVRNDERVTIIWGNYTRQDHLEMVVNAINLQNELLKTLTLDNKNDIEEVKRQLQIQTDRIDRLTTTTRSAKEPKK